MSWTTLAVTLTFVGSSFVTPFAGFEPDAFPIPQDNPPAQPAGYAFAIWGVIYLWLIVSATFGVFKRSDDATWGRARAPLVLSLGVGTFWLSVASTSPVWAMVMIWAMLLTAIWALAAAPKKDWWLLRAPLALYAGWLAAASWVSVALVGAGHGIFMGDYAWAFVVVLGATLLSMLILLVIGDIAPFAAAVSWALIAIALKSAHGPTEIAMLAGLSAMGIVGLTIMQATTDQA